MLDLECPLALRLSAQRILMLGALVCGPVRMASAASMAGGAPGAPGPSSASAPESPPSSAPASRPSSTSSSTPTSTPARITLEAALVRAFARNPSVATANQEIARAEALLRQAHASFFPLLNGNATYTRLDGDRFLQTGMDAAGQPIRTVIVSKDQLAANLTLTVPLLAPLGWTAAKRAKAGIEVARASEEDVRRTLAAGVARAYLQIFTHRKQRDALLRALETARAHHLNALTRMQGGAGNALDEARAGQEEAADESQIETAEMALARDREALGVLLGADSAYDATDDVALPPLPSPEDASRESETRRADLVALRRRRDAAAVARQSDWASYAPLLAAVVQPFYQNPPSLTQPHTGWQAQLILSIPLYDGGMRQGVSRERVALLAEAEQALEASLRQVSADIRVAWSAVAHADRSYEAAQRATVLANKAAQLAAFAYKAGATTNLELIDAERGARDAETQAELAADAARSARLDLLLASGRFPG